MSRRPTPETDALVPEFLNGGEVPDIFAHARKLERERDEAREELSRLHHWVERRSQDGFIDSQTHEQNITRCYDALYDRLDAAERALMEIEDRCVDGEDACDDIQKIRDIAVKALVAGQ